MYQKLTSNSVQTIITKMRFQSLLFNFISKLWANFCINLWEENVLVPRKLLHNNITTHYALFNVKKMRSIFYLLNGRNDIAIHRKIVCECVSSFVKVPQWIKWSFMLEIHFVFPFFTIYYTCYQKNLQCKNSTPSYLPCDS